MPRFMVAWRWLGPDTPEVESLIPRERALLEEWRRDGILLDRFITGDEMRGWLVLSAESEAALERRLDELPLRPNMACEVFALGE